MDESIHHIVVRAVRESPDLPLEACEPFRSLREEHVAILKQRGYRHGTLLL
jgi:hypothetical protein